MLKSKKNYYTQRKPFISNTLFFVVIYTISYFIFPIIKMYCPGWISNNNLYNRELASDTILLSFLGIIFFLIGLLTTMHSNFIARFSKKFNFYRMKKKRLLPLWILLLLLIFVFIFYNMSRFGVRELIFNRTVAFRGMGLTLFSYATLNIYASIFCLYVYRYHKTKIVIYFQVVVILIASFGSRGTLLTFLLSLLLIPKKNEKIITTKFFKLPILISLIIIIMVGIVIIRQPNNKNFTITILKRGIINTFHEGEMFLSVYDQYKKNLLLGKTLFDIRYIFMPRQLFSNKPIVWGKAIFEVDLNLKDPKTLFGTSYAFGQLSELFANFGITAIIVGMYLWGLFFGFLEQIKKNCNYFSIGYFLYILTFYFILWIFRHGLLGLVQISIFPCLFLIFIAPIIFKKKEGYKIFGK